jgi:putative acetyltransferase
MIGIRGEHPADAAAIGAVTRAAFRDGPHASHTEHLIVDALRREGQLAVSLVAEAASSLVGHVAVSAVGISDGTAGWYGLGPLSVLPQWQGRGVGSQLVGEALRALRARGAAGCVVLGEPAYYQHFGFRADPHLHLPGAAPEYFQAIGFGAPRARGTVSYHPAFGIRA